MTQLCKHHRWANLTLIDACSVLPNAVLDASLPGAFGSVRDTLRHIVVNEGRYLASMPGVPPLAVWPDQGEGLAFGDLRERAANGGDALIGVATTSVEDGVIHREWGGQIHAIPLSTIMTQMINHGADHRSQIATILSQQGVTPPPLDAWAFLAAEGGAA